MMLLTRRFDQQAQDDRTTNDAQSLGRSGCSAQGTISKSRYQLAHDRFLRIGTDGRDSMERHIFFFIG